MHYVLCTPIIRADQVFITHLMKNFFSYHQPISFSVSSPFFPFLLSSIFFFFFLCYLTYVTLLVYQESIPVESLQFRKALKHLVFVDGETPAVPAQRQDGQRHSRGRVLQQAFQRQIAVVDESSSFLVWPLVIPRKIVFIVVSLNSRSQSQFLEGGWQLRKTEISDSRAAEIESQLRQRDASRERGKVSIRQS